MKELTRTRGIYYLFKNKKIVYIGQSSFCEKRIYSHAKNKDFDSYKICNINSNNLSNLEAQEILNYKPKYNYSLPNNNLYWSLRKYFNKVLKIKKFGFKRKKIELRNANIEKFTIKNRDYYLKSKLNKFYGL